MSSSRPSSASTSPKSVRAFFNGKLVAESDDVRVVEGVTYFPRNAVLEGVLVDSPTTTRCPWKGKASYFHVDVGDDTVLDAAFQYENPWPLAKRRVSDRIGFWNGVIIER